MFTIYKGLLIDRLPIADQDHVVIMHPLDRSGTHLDVPFRIWRRSRATARCSGPSPASITSARCRRRSPERQRAVNLATAVGHVELLHDARHATRCRTADPRRGRRRRRDATMVLSYQTWQRRYGGERDHHRPDAQPTVSRGAPLRIVGVAPPGFTYPVGHRRVAGRSPSDFDGAGGHRRAPRQRTRRRRTARAALNRADTTHQSVRADRHASAKFIPIAGVDSHDVRGHGRRQRARDGHRRHAGGRAACLSSRARTSAASCSSDSPRGSAKSRCGARSAPSFGDVVQLFVIENSARARGRRRRADRRRRLLIRGLTIIAPLSLDASRPAAERRRAARA